MVSFTPKGAIFDLDDTLLKNVPDVGYGMHERARHQAIKEVGRKYDIQALADITEQQNLEAFLNAQHHTVESAVWNALVMTGVADSEVVNPQHPLLREIVELKNVYYKQILIEDGCEVAGATAFVTKFAAKYGNDKVAIASMAVRPDIDLSLKILSLDTIFSDAHIKSFETVTHPKPHHEVFDQAFISFGLAEADRPYVCAFEDDPRGIMSAKAAGLFTCAITTRFKREKLETLEFSPDLIADSFDEFTRLFKLNTP